tara:strand:+ start:829 stop:930 length:102 start_codon:yes stop_codon:yes gene_type:complete
MVVDLIAWKTMAFGMKMKNLVPSVAVLNQAVGK